MNGGGFNLVAVLAALEAVDEAGADGEATENFRNFRNFRKFRSPTPANRVFRGKAEAAAVICICCRQPIAEPVAHWWGGDPVHRDCGERAWARTWQAVPAERRGGT